MFHTPQARIPLTQILPYSSPNHPSAFFGTTVMLFASPQFFTACNIPIFEDIFVHIAPSIAAPPQNPPIITPCIFYPEPQLDIDQFMMNEPYYSYFMSNYNGEDDNNLFYDQFLRIQPRSVPVLDIFRVLYPMGNNDSHSTDLHDKSILYNNQQYHYLLQQQCITHKSGNSQTQHILYADHLTCNIPHHVLNTNPTANIIFSLTKLRHHISQTLQLQYADIPLAIMNHTDNLLNHTSCLPPNTQTVLFFNYHNTIIPIYMTSATMTTTQTHSLSHATLFSISTLKSNITRISITTSPSKLIESVNHDQLSVNSQESSHFLTELLKKENVIHGLNNPALRTTTTSHGLYKNILFSLFTFFAESCNDNANACPVAKNIKIVGIQGPTGSGKSQIIQNVLKYTKHIYNINYTHYDVGEKTGNTIKRTTIANTKNSSLITLNATDLYHCLPPTLTRFDSAIIPSDFLKLIVTYRTESLNTTQLQLSQQKQLRSICSLFSTWLSQILHIPTENTQNEQNTESQQSLPKSIIVQFSGLDFFLRDSAFDIDSVNTLFQPSSQDVDSHEDNRGMGKNSIPSDVECTAVFKYIDLFISCFYELINNSTLNHTSIQLNNITKVCFLFESVNVDRIFTTFSENIKHLQHIYTLNYPIRGDNNILSMTIVYRWLSHTLSPLLPPRTDDVDPLSQYLQQNREIIEVSKDEILLCKIFQVHSDYTKKYGTSGNSQLLSISQLLLKYRHFLPTFINNIILPSANIDPNASPADAASVLNNELWTYLFSFPQDIVERCYYSASVDENNNLQATILNIIKYMVLNYPGLLSLALIISNSTPSHPIASITQILQHVTVLLRSYVFSSQSQSTPSNTQQHLFLITQMLFHQQNISQIIYSLHNGEYLPLTALSLISHLPITSIAQQIPSVLPKPTQNGEFYWENYIGNSDAISKLQQIVKHWQLSLNNSHIMLDQGSTGQSKVSQLHLSSNILLHSDSGNGKTLLAYIIAHNKSLVMTNASLNSVTMNIITLNPSDVFQKYLGESEKRIRHTFARARQLSPCVIIIDNIDTIASNRNKIGADDNDHGGVELRVLSTLLNELDGVDTNLHGDSTSTLSSSPRNVFVVATCRSLDNIDSALLRNGRFDHVIHIPAPQNVHTAELLILNQISPFISPSMTQIDCNDESHKFEVVDYIQNTLAPQCIQYHMSAGDIINITRGAIMAGLTELQQNVFKNNQNPQKWDIKLKRRHFEYVLQQYYQQRIDSSLFRSPPIKSVHKTSRVNHIFPETKNQHCIKKMRGLKAPRTVRIKDEKFREKIRAIFSPNEFCAQIPHYPPIQQDIPQTAFNSKIRFPRISYTKLQHFPSSNPEKERLLELLNTPSSYYTKLPENHSNENQKSNNFTISSIVSAPTALFNDTILGQHYIRSSLYGEEYLAWKKSLLLDSFNDNITLVYSDEMLQFFSPPHLTIYHLRRVILRDLANRCEATYTQTNHPSTVPDNQPIISEPQRTDMIKKYTLKNVDLFIIIQKMMIFKLKKGSNQAIELEINLEDYIYPDDRLIILFPEFF